jgi:outer membrane protein TolC
MIKNTFPITLLGLISEQSDIQINPTPLEVLTIPDTDQIIKTALACRPDLRAAEIEIEIAGKQLGWEKSKILNLTLMLDANAEAEVRKNRATLYYSIGWKTLSF